MIWPSKCRPLNSASIGPKGRILPSSAIGSVCTRADLLFFDDRAMDVIGRAATLYRKRGFQAMLFHVTTEDDIRVIDEQGPGEMEAGDSTFASEQQLHQLAKEWPMKRLVAIWNRLSGVQAVAPFTDRKTAIRRIWRATQFTTEADRTTARWRPSKAQHGASAVRDQCEGR